MKACNLCRKKFRNEAAFNDHVESDSHKKNVELQKEREISRREMMKARGNKWSSTPLQESTPS